MTPWETVFILFLIALIVMVVISIPVIMRLRDVLNHLHETLSILNRDLPEILENTREVSKRANATSKKVEDAVDDLVHLEHMVSKEIKQPIQNIAQSVGTLLQLLNKVFYRKSRK